MLVKFIIVFLLLFILFNLFRALYLMVSNNQSGKPMSHYLGRRVLYSALVIALILTSAFFGFIPLNSNPVITEHTQIQTNIAIQRLQSANTKQPLEKQNAALNPNAP
ncbi:DUF2909 domain-containing protein [Pseudoalteromonas aurantia]|uniref:DUF2909 domain-containing protein n=2 Tax=Pseudoalteromonas aurantia TaxID=43654 RepID=A0A5S3V927_9GAMM|nr:DUF2909 domain-containing protein [Pseudoalteromonas aurantia]TMO58761.1 DUF2909 domain-containing protein [Pseudoalteromonas aurantia]TMO68216.1 DUF2909 domain-containing protein [Pseudoalteromonas aurantia]TMO77078.1 DUF2909 domain-containing protein [Pseudoalteromonas aurantia]